MVDEAKPGRVWPVAVMALLVGLLGTFVVIRVFRKDDRPPETKPVVRAPEENPAPAGDPKAGPSGTKATPETGPKPESPEAVRLRTEEAARKLTEAQAAAEAGRVEEALAAVKASRALNDTSEAQRLEGVYAEVLDALAKKKRDEQDAKMRELGSAVSKLRDENRWDAALAAIEAAADLRERLDHDRLRRDVLANRAEAGQAYDTHVAAAKKLRTEGRFAEARAKAGLAIRYYPERKEAADLLAAIDRELQSSNMIRIPPPPKGTIVRLGQAGKDGEPERVYKGGAFLIDRFEVTNEEYQYFVDATGHRPPASRWWPRGERRFATGYERHPVVGVMAADAERYAAWAGKRLPTEDEWEYAARYVDGRAFPWGEHFMPAESVYNCNSLEYARSVQRFEPFPVGTLPASGSALQVMDLAGNVWEWTATTEPGKDGAAPLRVLKGGSYMTREDACRSANRLLDDADVSHLDVGFRCVRNP